MVLGFKPQFVSKILDGSKIHTFRADTQLRWKEGRSIQFATGRRTKNYKQFLEGKCKSIQTLFISHDRKAVWLATEKGLFIPGLIGKLDVELIAKNDGFESVEDFWKWFNVEGVFRCIHWTDFKY